MEKTIKELFPNVIEPIEKAFELNGVQYYQFSSVELPVLRYYGVASANDEWEMRCNKKNLIEHLDAIDEALNKGKHNRAVVLTQQLRDRTKLGNDFDTVYTMAAACVFDATEDPNNFDFQYNYKKAQIFKEAPIDVFFLLKTPAIRLIRLGELSTQDLLLSFQIVQKINHLQHQKLTENTSLTSKMGEYVNSIISPTIENKV